MVWIFLFFNLKLRVQSLNAKFRVDTMSNETSVLGEPCSEQDKYRADYRIHSSTGGGQNKIHIYYQEDPGVMQIFATRIL